MVTFIQAVYALATFVHISNISVLTGPILTKLFVPNFLGVKFFLTNIFLLKLFGSKIIWAPNGLGPKIILDQKSYLNTNIF